MQPQRATADPIRPGFSFTATVNFQSATGAVADLTTATRLAGAVRSDPGSPLLATPTVTAVSATQLSFTLTTADTLALDGLRSAQIDFAAEVGGVWVALPALFVWPVAAEVTFP